MELVIPKESNVPKIQNNNNMMPLNDANFQMIKTYFFVFFHCTFPIVNGHTVVFTQ